MIAPVAVVLLAVIGSTIAHAWYTERFSKTISNTQELRDMALRLKDIDLSFGPWEGEDVADTKECAAPIGGRLAWAARSLGVKRRSA